MIQRLICRYVYHCHAWRWSGPVAHSTDPSWCARCPATREGEPR